MILKIFFVTIVIAVGTFGIYTPSVDEYLLSGVHNALGPLNDLLLDGPISISSAPTTPTTNLNPTLKQMQYYNYYAASMYCQYELNDLTCTYCQMFKKDVNRHKVLMNNVYDTTALFAVSKYRKEIVVTFRGSQNVPNAVLDFTMISGRNPGVSSNIKIHRGFYIATMSLYQEIVENVRRELAIHPDYKVVIAGHSLGGSMARLMTFLLLSFKPFLVTPSYELYTYGECRVGNKEFAEFMNNQNITTARIVARADFVPHFIPTSISTIPLLGDYYIHAQTEFWINGEVGQRFCDQSVYEDSTCSNSLGPAYSVQDHLNYFDVNYAICYLNQPLVFAAVPFDILQPVDDLPPLPEPISNLIGDVAGLIVPSPLLGR